MMYRGRVDMLDEVVFGNEPPTADDVPVVEDPT
jgi:hypothetical protein